MKETLATKLKASNPERWYATPLALGVGAVLFALIKLRIGRAENPQQNTDGWRPVGTDELRGPDPSVDPYEALPPPTEVE